jgi:hypothetical protein
MTGQEINKLFEQQIGQTYSGIEDIFKKQRRFDRALIDAIEDKYGKYALDQQYEELSSFIKTEEPMSIDPGSTNEVSLITNKINHILSAKAKYYTLLTDTVIVSVSNTTPIIVELFNPNNIRKGDRLLITGIAGNTAANGEHYVTPLNRFKFALYSTPGTGSPVAGNGDYAPSAGVSISKVSYNYCQLIKADEKISAWKTGTKRFPLYEYSETFAKFYPNDALEGFPAEVTMNYVTSDVRTIDLTDGVFDYTTIYPEKFIYNVISFAAKSFDLSFRDYTAAQAANQDIMTNP